ncbi:MAG: PqqD family protein [Clostridia bacterium]|nr:PqqD family protein [Clostridia bacterium]
MLKTKKGFILRRMLEEYMVVAVGEAGQRFNGMIRLNATGAFLWEALEKGSTEDELVQKLLDRFEDLDEPTARMDLKEFLSTIRFALEDEQP